MAGPVGYGGKQDKFTNLCHICPSLFSELKPQLGQDVACPFFSLSLFLKINKCIASQCVPPMPTPFLEWERKGTQIHCSNKRPLETQRLLFYYYFVLFLD